MWCCCGRCTKEVTDSENDFYCCCGRCKNKADADGEDRRGVPSNLQNITDHSEDTASADSATQTEVASCSTTLEPTRPAATSCVNEAAAAACPDEIEAAGWWEESAVASSSREIQPLTKTISADSDDQQEEAPEEIKLIPMFGSLPWVDSTPIESDLLVYDSSEELRDYFKQKYAKQQEEKRNKDSES